MKYTRSIINELLKGDEHIMLLWNEEDCMDLNKENVYLDYMSLFIGLSGKITIHTDCNIWEAGASEIQFFAYDKDVKLLDKTVDYSSVGIIFSRKYWNDSLMNINPALYAAKLSPVITVDDEQRKVILDFIYEIKRLKEDGRGDYDPLVINCILGLFYHIGRTYEHNIYYLPKNSHLKMLSEFAALLNSNYREHRDVDFYADKLNVSRSYFAAVVQKMTGYSVGACIRKYVALKICHLLKNTEKSVKEIAFDMNFNSVSNFCKFFRNQMEKSPEEYRAYYHQQVRDFRK